MVTNFSQEEQHTIDAYDENAEAWASTHTTNGFWQNERERLEELLLPGSQLLEIGSGSGRDAMDLNKIYNYTGIDVSNGLLAIARQNNPDADLRNMSVYDMEFEDDTFDGFWTAATLLHIPQDKIDIALREIRRVTKSSGVGFISIKQGEGEVLEDIDESGNTQRLFSYYNSERFKQILRDNGLEIIEEEYRPLSDRTKFLIFYVRVIK